MSMANTETGAPPRAPLVCCPNCGSSEHWMEEQVTYTWQSVERLRAEPALDEQGVPFRRLRPDEWGDWSPHDLPSECYALECFKCDSRFEPEALEAFALRGEPAAVLSYDEAERGWLLARLQKVEAQIAGSAGK